MPERIFLHVPNCISAAGRCLAETRETVLVRPFAPLPTCSDLIPGKNIAYGMVSSVADFPANPDFQFTRTKHLIDECVRGMTGLKNLLGLYRPERISVVLGASTSGMHEIESAQKIRRETGNFPDSFSIDALNLNEPTRYLAACLGAKGVVYTVSNACASGAMSLAIGAMLLRSNLADAVVCGGIDGYSRFTTLGFYHLGVVSEEPATPFGSDRHGINLGEGGALVVLSRQSSPVELAGIGLSCDAYHPSAPDPQGAGAAAAMAQALASAGIEPQAVDFISAHGTGTELNDAMEARAIAAVFGSNVPTASLKPFTGHTLAGAGALQAAFAWMLLQDNPQGLLPASFVGTGPDPDLASIDLVTERRTTGAPLSYVLGNAFAFGGANVSLLFHRTGLS